MQCVSTCKLASFLFLNSSLIKSSFFSSSFLQGLANVINLESLQTFSYKECQILISGDSCPVDLEDLKRHTVYNGYSPEHPVIVKFWNIVSKFDKATMQKLLKFVTSCSRPPLFGFKNLVPKFAIHNAGLDERLPTSATCMNLLKLPEFQDENVLKEKLLYTLDSGAGFELS